MFEFKRFLNYTAASDSTTVCVNHKYHVSNCEMSKDQMVPKFDNLQMLCNIPGSSHHLTFAANSLLTNFNFYRKIKIKINFHKNLHIYRGSF